MALQLPLKFLIDFGISIKINFLMYSKEHDEQRDVEILLWAYLTFQPDVS